jgi:predicted secreted protein
MNKALAVTKTAPGMTARTVGYTTSQVYEKGRMVRWRVSQLLRIETADFTAGANLATRLQGEGLLLVSLAFSVSPEARRIAVVKLQHDALIEWQARAREAAASMGYAGFTPGRLSVNVNDASPMPPPRFATQAMAAEAAPPVAVAGGTSEIGVTVGGEAILNTRR